jgi:hypothetical protein
MTARELAQMVRDWSDALIVAEVVNSPFLRVTDQWDLHDWEAVDVPGGLLFRHHDRPGHISEEVMLTEPEDAAARAPVVAVEGAGSVVQSLPAPA